MSCGVEDGGEGVADVMAIIEYKDEIHPMTITLETKMSEVYGGLTKKWSEITPSMGLSYKIPMDDRFVKLYFEEDLVEMVRMHDKLKVKLCKMVVLLEDTRKRAANHEKVEGTKRRRDDRVVNDTGEGNASAVREWNKAAVKGVGQIFEDAEHFRRVLKSHAIAMNRSYIFKKNERERVVVVCSDTDCQWKIRATTHVSDGSFGIRTCNLKHTCGCDNLKERGHPKADANWVAGIYKEKFRSQPMYSPKALVDDIRRTYGVEVPYHRVWAGKEIAMKEINGDDWVSFDKLRWYCDAVVETNPGSVADLEIFEGSLKFRRIYICLSACIRGFVIGCRPLIFLDGTHIKSKWKGCLLSAVSKDADNGLFTVAYASKLWNWAN